MGTDGSGVPHWVSVMGAVALVSIVRQLWHYKVIRYVVYAALALGVAEILYALLFLS